MFRPSQAPALPSSKAAFDLQAQRDKFGLPTAVSVADPQNGRRTRQTGGASKEDARTIPTFVHSMGYDVNPSLNKYISQENQR